MNKKRIPIGISIKKLIVARETIDIDLLTRAKAEIALQSKWRVFLFREK